MQNEYSILEDLNIRIGHAESNGSEADRKWLESVLAPQFVFRRANKRVDNRVSFLEGVTHSEPRETLVTSMELFRDRALVNCIVTQNKDSVSNRFHNIRLFIRIDGSWKLLAWANELLDEYPGEVSGPSLSQEPDDREADPVGLATYEALFGEPNKKPLIGLRKFTINHLFAKIWSRSLYPNDEAGMITMRERSMITVALLAAQGRNEQLKEHLKGARNRGISKDQALEIMIHVAHYAGWAAGNSGQGAVLEVFD
jgi:4-carboxymuconolactone decarboxylase